MSPDSTPLDSVAINPCERHIENFLYDSYLRVFVHNDLSKKLNMSFDEFINRPRHQIESIIRVIESFNKEEAAAAKKALNGLEASKKP